jgi:hypothetical protein
MRKLTLLFVFATLLCHAQNKKSEFGIKAGLNVSIFSASVNSYAAFKPGLNVGVYSKTQLADYVSWRGELNYSQQGEKDDYGSGDLTTTSVNYLTVPVLLEVGKKVTANIGPQFGFLLSAHERGTLNGQPADDDLKPVMKSSDLGIVFGLGFNPGGNLHFGIRYNMGMTAIFNTMQGPGYTFPEIKNQVLNGFVSYSF